MSYSLDVNILVYAANTGDARHERALAFLEDCINGSDVLCLAWPTLMGYLRIVTNPRILPSPVSPEKAIANIEALMGAPQVRVITEGARFLDIYREVTAALGGRVVRGDDVPDAHLAALLREHGVATLYTSDRDFRRFDFLKVKNPFA